MKLILSLSMLAASPLLAIAVPLERSSEAIPEDVGKRQAVCGGSVSVAFQRNLVEQHLPLRTSVGQSKEIG